MDNILYGFALGVSVGAIFYIYEYKINKSLEDHMHGSLHKALNVFIYTSGVVIMLMVSKTHFSSYLYSLAGLIFVVILDFILRR